MQDFKDKKKNFQPFHVCREHVDVVYRLPQPAVVEGNGFATAKQSFLKRQVSYRSKSIPLCTFSFQ